MNELKKEISITKSIYIYGAGAISNIMFLYIKQMGFEEKVESFLVSTMAGNSKEKYGVVVNSIEDVKEISQDSLVIVAVQRVTQPEVEQRLQSKDCKRYKLIEPEDLLNDFYRSLYVKPIQKNKILFMNVFGLGYGCNPKYIAEALIKLDVNKSLDLVWAVSNDNSTFPPEIRTVKLGTLEYYQELATAHVWVDNARKQIDVRKREGQYYIQAWHGAAPIKRVEKDVEDKLTAAQVVNSKLDSEMADLFLSGSQFYTELYKKSFWYDGKIMEVGLPRHDVFWKSAEARKKVRNYYNIKDNEAIVLYAPTFRHDFTNEYYDLDINMVRESLEQRFQHPFIFMVSKHPNNRYLSYCLDSKEYIAVENYEDFQELLATADVLITDYSGCMYDFSYTGKPVFLYQRDFKAYCEDRSFYIPMENLPYIKANSNVELVEKIALFDEKNYTCKLKQFMKEMGNFDEGKASKKVALHIMKIMQEGDKDE